MLSAPPRTNRIRRGLEDAKPARTLNNPPPPRFRPNLDDREIRLLETRSGGRPIRRQIRARGSLSLARAAPPK